MRPSPAGIGDAPLLVHKIEAVWMSGIRAVGLIVDPVDDDGEGGEVELRVTASRD